MSDKQFVCDKRLGSIYSSAWSHSPFRLLKLAQLLIHTTIPLFAQKSPVFSFFVEVVCVDCVDQTS